MDLKIVAQTVQGQTVRKLRDAIISGIFQPGDRLIEADLCNRLGVSRPSVREALRSLEAERLIMIVPNKGPIVPILTLVESREIYDVRSLLEGEAAALFAARASKEAIATMRRALDAFDAAVKTDDKSGQLETTRQFYEEILSGCGNRIIYEVLAVLLARITFLRAKSMSQEGRAQKSGKEMRAIFRAIAAHDSEAARTAAMSHVRYASEAAAKAYAIEQKKPTAA
ncbi:GntR family transcriptional regulator [Beijerinckia sp. L45]|uniref:GntR family transcriptional regulator n=1 Tax=Beijerinckia sp. L45 TaxID=1641855 RepID=UPI001FEEA257|nr:GntR family transcriptional regulator [Beijerinckia sp. L45]